MFWDIIIVCTVEGWRGGGGVQGSRGRGEGLGTGWVEALAELS